MAKDRKKLQHIHSSIPDKQPTAASLEVGEIAVNNAQNQEFLSIKNSNDKVVRFSSDEQIITWTEKKEVMPYSGTVDNVHLDTNRSNIEIKLNQVAASNTVKHNVVNGAVDIDGDLVNPTTDSGLTNGAGFAIDMSLYAMQGANPTFSGITDTCYTNLNGTTTIKGTDGACGSKLDIDVATEIGKFSTANNSVGTATTNVTSANTTIGTDILHVSGTTTETHDGAVTITNNNDKKETTKGNVYNNVSGETVETHRDDVTVTVVGDDTRNVSGVSTTNIGSNEFVNITGASTTTIGSNKNVNVSGNTNTNVGGNVTTNTTGTTTINNSSNTTVNVTGGTDINSCDRVYISTNYFKVGQCEETYGSAELDFCAKFKVKSNNISLEQCVDGGSITITEKNSTINGENLTINESGDTAINNGEDLIINTTGDATITTTGVTTIASTDDVCISSQDDAAFYGKNNTKVGVSCGGAVTTTATVQSSGVTNIYGPTTNVSGTTLNTTYSTANTKVSVINQSGATYNVTASTETHNATSYTVNSTSACIVTTNTAGIGGDVSTNIGANCEGNAISNTTNIYGDTINNSGNTINSKATIINNKVSKYNISGDTSITGDTYISGDTNITDNLTVNKNIYVSGDSIINGDTIVTGDTVISGDTIINGDTYISGDTYIKGDINIEIQCDELTSTTISDSFCEVFDRSKLTFKTGDYAASEENLKWYELWQDGKQLKDQNGDVVRIDIPKDHILKDVSIVRGKLNGTTFTPCTGTGDTACTWFIKLVWNVFDPSTGHTDDKTVYLPADDFVNDYVFDSSNAIKFEKTYDGKQYHVSADTTVVIKNADGTGTTTFAKSNAIHSLNSYTLNSTSGDVKTESAKTNWTYDPFAEKKSIVVPTDASHINRKTVSWSYGSVTDASGNTYDPGEGTVNTTGTGRTMSFVIPKSLKDLNNNLSNLNFVTGTTSVSGSPYNGSDEKTITIPSCVSHIGRKTLSWSLGKPTAGSHDAGGDCTGSDSFNIPSSLAHLAEWSDNCLSVNNNLCVSGTVTATGGMYTSSDERLKDDIQYIKGDEISRANNVRLRSFYYKSDASRRKTYGVIAQDVENVGLEELIHYDQNGMMAVDYIGLLLLKLAALEKEIDILKFKLNEKNN